jgi:hypothetical protein
MGRGVTPVIDCSSAARSQISCASVSETQFAWGWTVQRLSSDHRVLDVVANVRERRDQLVAMLKARRRILCQATVDDVGEGRGMCSETVWIGGAFFVTWAMSTADANAASNGNFPLRARNPTTPSE